MLSQLILGIVCISFSVIAIAVTCIGVILRSGWSSPIVTVDTIMFGIFPSVLFVFLIFKQERFHLTFKVFIFIICMSTIHLRLSASWGTMICLMILFIVNRAICSAFWSWGSAIFVQCIDGLLGDLLEFPEVPQVFQLIHLTRKSSFKSTFSKQALKACSKIYWVRGGRRTFGYFHLLLFLSRRN